MFYSLTNSKMASIILFVSIDALKLAIATLRPFFPISPHSTGCSNAQQSLSANTSTSSGSDNNALSPSLRNRGISPTLVTTTGLSVNKYSPNLVGNPFCACRLLGRANANTAALVSICGISFAEITPVNTTLSLMPKASTNCKLPLSSVADGVLPMIYNFTSECFLATIANASIKRLTPSLLLDAVPQYAIYLSSVGCFSTPSKRCGSTVILMICSLSSGTPMLAKYFFSDVDITNRPASFLQLFKYLTFQCGSLHNKTSGCSVIS